MLPRNATVRIRGEPDDQQDVATPRKVTSTVRGLICSSTATSKPEPTTLMWIKCGEVHEKEYPPPNKEADMTRNILTLLAAAALAVCAQTTFAQASSPSRADVKAETKAAGKSGQLAPAGDRPTKQPSKASDTTREARKSQTKADQKAGNLAEAGESPTPQPSKGSETTREARKAQTKADQKAGKIQPAGESK